MSKNTPILAITITIVSLSTFCIAMPTQIDLHWDGIGSSNPNEIGGYYQNPSTNGVGYGLDYPYGNWACEIIFDQVYNLQGHTDGSELITFCLEWTEYLIGENNFHAFANDGAISGGRGNPGYDALDDETAWLYSQYIAGNSFGFTDLNRRAAVIQEAIWDIENELDPSWALYTETAAIIQSAQNAVTNGWVNANVVVLNIYWDSNNQQGQDVLAIIPEPATMAILTLGALLIRKRK